MKKWMRFSVIAFITVFLCGLTFVSCDDDDKLPTSVEDAFYAKYPNAKAVSWEKTHNYYVFEFINNNDNFADAFFSHKAEWLFTEIEISYAQLPAAVRTAFEKSEWSKWLYNDGDIEQIDQPQGTLYLLDLENGNEEIELLYLPDGTLKKSAVDIFYPYWNW
ncbi:MAG: PepSY-like domain-containing protein [Bacteroidales bacterium]